MAKSDKAGIAGGSYGDCENEIIKRLLFKNLNKVVGWFNSQG